MPFRIGILGASMFLFLRVVALIAAMMLNCGVASADGVAKDVMPGCRGFIKDGASPADSTYSVGLSHGKCVGIVQTLVSVGSMCNPHSVTIKQNIEIVVQYIDSRLARLHEDFIMLALEALREAWSCKN